MGATKRLCELVVGAMSRDSKTVFCAVRFGNVMGSRGSVVPLFWKQIEQGGPISVTHPEATRYFMTVPEAASLIIQAAAFAGQGQIFMLDMGEAMGIVELAEKMIKMRGLAPEEINIVYTGLRPGDKVKENLTGEMEKLSETDHPGLLLVDKENESPSLAWLEKEISDLGRQLDLPTTVLAEAIYKLVRADDPNTTTNTQARSVD